MKNTKKIRWVIGLVIMIVIAVNITCLFLIIKKSLKDLLNIVRTKIVNMLSKINATLPIQFKNIVPNNLDLTWQMLKKLNKKKVFFMFYRNITRILITKKKSVKPIKKRNTVGKIVHFIIIKMNLDNSYLRQIWQNI